MAPSERSETSGLGRGFASGHPALVAYLMAGYPDRETCLESLGAAAAAGADVIELGVPYGDALADGPVIVRAAHEAMTANPGGFGLAESIDLAREFIEDSGRETVPPVALMTYLNPMFAMGFDEVARRSAEAGVGGFIVPDMPPDDRLARVWIDGARAEGLDTVFLVAPTSTDERIDTVVVSSRGFVYCVSTTGVTGERDTVDEGIAELVSRVRARTTLPIAVGFGVSTPEQAAAVASRADGAVVGSAIVKRQAEPEALERFVSDLARAVHEAPQCARGVSRP